jgi:hypothetical protein
MVVSWNDHNHIKATIIPLFLGQNPFAMGRARITPCQSGKIQAACWPKPKRLSGSAIGGV